MSMATGVTRGTHGALAGGDRAAAEAADHDRHPGRPRSQPEEHLAGDPARRADRRHRPVRLGQVEPGVRHDLRRGAAPLHGIALDVRQAVRRAGRQARRRFRLRPLPGDLDRAEDDRQQSPLDGRHDDRHLELSQPAVRDDRRAPLPSHRRGRAQPHREPDPRSGALAARRRRDRAARADLQGLRRGSELRLHRGAEEGLPPADRRRHAARHLRLRRARSGRRRGPGRQRRCSRHRRHQHRRHRRSLHRRAEAREGDQGRHRQHPARRRRAAAAARREGRDEERSRTLLPRPLQPDASTSSTETSGRSSSSSTTPRARAGRAAGSASTRSRTRNCWSRIRSAASWAAVSCARRSSTTPTPGTAG